MRILLDTHILLWWLSSSPQLPGSARDAIANPENTIFVSAVTLWEIWLKQSLGKLRLPWLHRDPFDRMLVAQARVAGLRLLTADEAIAAYSEPVLLAK